MQPAGIEPTLQESESCVLSIRLRLPKNTLLLKNYIHLYHNHIMMSNRIYFFFFQLLYTTARPTPHKIRDSHKVYAPSAVCTRIIFFIFPLCCYVKLSKSDQVSPTAAVPVRSPVQQNQRSHRNQMSLLQYAKDSP